MTSRGPFQPKTFYDSMILFYDTPPFRNPTPPGPLPSAWQARPLGSGWLFSSPVVTLTFARVRVSSLNLPFLAASPLFHLSLLKNVIKRGRRQRQPSSALIAAGPCALGETQAPVRVPAEPHHRAARMAKAEEMLAGRAAGGDPRAPFLKGQFCYEQVLPSFFEVNVLVTLTIFNAI